MISLEWRKKSGLVDVFQKGKSQKTDIFIQQLRARIIVMFENKKIWFVFYTAPIYCIYITAINQFWKEIWFYVKY